MSNDDRRHLRPLERCVLSMRDRGMSDDEIATSINRSPAHVARIISWTKLPRRGPAPRQSARALERRVLAMRADGESYEQIAVRFKRGPEFIRRVEGLAHYRRAVKILG